VPDLGEQTMRVSKTSSPQKLGSAIFHGLTKQPHHPVVLRAIGAGAVNQAVKGLAIANGFLGVNGRSASFKVGFETVSGEQQDVSAMVFRANCD